MADTFRARFEAELKKTAEWEKTVASERSAIESEKEKVAAQWEEVFAASVSLEKRKEDVGKFEQRVEIADEIKKLDEHLNMLEQLRGINTEERNLNQQLRLVVDEAKALKEVRDKVRSERESCVKQLASMRRTAGINEEVSVRDEIILVGGLADKRLSALESCYHGGQAKRAGDVTDRVEGGQRMGGGLDEGQAERAGDVAAREGVQSWGGGDEGQAERAGNVAARGGGQGEAAAGVGGQAETGRGDVAARDAVKQRAAGGDGQANDVAVRVGVVSQEEARRQ